MNKISIPNQSAEYSPKKRTIQQSWHKGYPETKLKVKNSKNNHKSEECLNLQLMIHQSQNLNHDYFYSHKNNQDQLGLKSCQFKAIKSNDDTEHSSKNFFEQQNLSEAQMAQLNTIAILSAKIQQLESNFLDIKSYYTDKITTLKEQLQLKNKQTQNLNHTLKQLSNQQKTTQYQVSLLMGRISQSSAKLECPNLQNENKINKQSQKFVGMLPIMSRKSKKQGWQSGRKSRRLKRSQVLLKTSSGRKEQKSRVLKSQQMLFRPNNIVGSMGTIIEKTQLGYQVKKL